MDVGVLIREVADVVRPRVVENLAQRAGIILAVGELTVPVVDRDLVPLADPSRIALEMLSRRRFELLERMRIVHHRDPRRCRISSG
jgi:hypothetical protein